VYQNHVGSGFTSTGQLNAMILPAPLYLTSNPNAQIEVLDLSEYADLFEELDKCFPVEEVDVYDDDELPTEECNSRAFLEVMEVGGYKVSVARSIDDLRKINPTVFFR